MRKTLVLTVEEEMADFIRNQQGLVDPSAFINLLFHKDMKRKGIQLDPAIKADLQHDDVLQEFELLLDENTPAAD